YAVVASNLAAGSYVLSAAATDNGGLAATNSITISVQPPATPPTVSVTSPTNWAIFIAPASFAISASALSSGGTIGSVQFLVDGNAVGTATAQSYSASASGLAAGSHSITAIATDNGGLKATNSVQVTVAAPPTVAITSPSSGAVFSSPAQ